MDPVKVVLGAAAIIFVVKVYRFAAAHIRRMPARRGWVLVGSVAALAVVPFLVPWVSALRPPLSESPAGLLVVLPKAAAVSLLALAATGTLLGALFPWLGRADRQHRDRG
jgi:hypothetical protein